MISEEDLQLTGAAEAESRFGSFLSHRGRRLANADGPKQIIVVTDPGRALITGDPNDLLNFKIQRSGASKTRRPISTTTARALSKRC
jgi:hypothetical protein